MSLSQALVTSLSGLRTTQAGLALVASNVANAETPGYVRKTLVQTATTSGSVGSGVRTTGINRELDQYVLRQLRVETSGASYAGSRADFYGRLQQIFGQPGASGSLESVYNAFTTSLQALATSPESYSTRTGVLNAAQALTGQLNGMSADIQSLRSDAESGLADAVALANAAMTRIASINQQLAASQKDDSAAAALKDQRDSAITQLAKLMDIRVVDGGSNQLNVFTTSGVQLVGTSAAQFSFDAQSTMVPTALYSLEPAARGVGTLTLNGANGQGIDLIANNSIRSGSIAALIEVRDHTLVQAQTQLDAIAAAMSRALSDRTMAGTAAVSGSQTGFDLDLSGLASGNSMRVTYTDALTNTTRTVTFVRVDDPAALPLTSATGPNDRLLGINFAGGFGSVASQIASALGSGFAVSNPSGSTLRILDDGAGGHIDIGAVTATTTVAGLTGGSAELPFFLDGIGAFTGAITGRGAQETGLAARISVNGALLADPSRLVVFRTSPLTQAGDGTRPEFLYRQLTSAALSFSLHSGIGTAASPFQGTLPGFMRQMLSQQGEAAAAAANLAQGQDVVLHALQQRMDDAAGVNIDQEMTTLLNLQNAYAANARVLSVVKEMFDMLSKI